MITKVPAFLFWSYSTCLQNDLKFLVDSQTVPALPLCVLWSPAIHMCDQRLKRPLIICNKMKMATWLLIKLDSAYYISLHVSFASALAGGELPLVWSKWVPVCFPVFPTYGQGVSLDFFLSIVFIFLEKYMKTGYIPLPKHTQGQLWVEFK